MRKPILLILCVATVCTLHAEGTALPYIDGADPVQCFGAGYAMQIGFELVGLTIRFLRSMRASGNVDVGG